MTTRRQFLRAAATAPFVPALASCSRGSSVGTSGAILRAGSASIPSSLKLTPQTIVVPDGARAVAGLAPGGKALRLVGTDGVKVGSTVVLQDVGVFKAQAVQRSGSEWLVTPAPCALQDLIHDGAIEVKDLRVDPRAGRTIGALWREEPGALASLLDLFAPALHADAFSKSGKIGDFDYQVQYDADADSVTFDATASGDLAGFAANINAKGHLDGFDLTYGAEMRSGNPERLGLLLKSLKGEVNLEASAQRHDNAAHPGKKMLKIPHEYSWPIVVDGIPFMLKLSVAMLLNEGLTNINAGARFGVKLNFKGSSGFEMRLPGEPKSQPKIDTALDTDFSFQHAESTGMGPQALLVAMQCPRLAFGLGLDLPFIDCFAGPYIDVVTSASHTFAGVMAMVPCQRNQLVISGTVGFEAAFLNVGTDMRTEVYNKEILKAVPDSKACRLES